VKIVYADDTLTTTTYDTLGRKTAATDQNGLVTEYAYDKLGKLTGVKNALADWTNYTYSLDGKLLTISDANNHNTNYEYDLLGRRVATILPLGQRSITTYDLVGNIKTTTDFNGNTTSYQYDAQNRLLEQSFTHDPAVKMTYTTDGQIATITDGRGVTSFSYDAQNRLLSHNDVDGSKISYTYDLAGNRTSVTTQVLNGSFNTTYYTFDERNRLDKVLSGGIVLTNYDYDAVNNLIQTTLSNGVIETRQYDKLYHLTNLQTSKGANVLTNFSYVLDKVGYRQKVNEKVGNSSRTVDYTYDDLYRLTKERVTDAVNGDRTTEFVYDKVANREQQKVTANSGVTTTTYQYDANDRLLKEKENGNDKVIYTYDNNGNTLTKTENGKTTESIWNDRGRLAGVKVKDAAGNVTQQVGYEYDASGIRVSQNVDGEITKYLIDANLPYAQAVVEYRPSGLVVVFYTHGNDLISQTRDGVSSFYHVDGLGSTRALSDGIGNLIDTYNYQAFGELLNSSGSSQNNYLFAGQQFNPVLGDYYNRARYYNPETGRFTRRDSYEGSIADPITLNKYIYANGNSINFTDPTGLYSQNFGYAVEDAIRPFYELDHPGDRISFGRRARPRGPGSLPILIKPDILNYTKQIFNEIKPFNPNGIRNGIAQMVGYYLTLGLFARYIPDVRWHRPPDVLLASANTRGVPRTDIIVFNIGGILFYTDQQNLESRIRALVFRSLEEGVERIQPLLLVAGQSSVNYLANSLALITIGYASYAAYEYTILQSRIALASFARI
jgi:RHS repeat-associated protein